MIPVTHTQHEPGPPGDLITSMTASEWDVFRTEHGGAWCWREFDQFVLHWIESKVRGHGDALMQAINQWANEERLTGRLVCEPDMQGFYAKYGWVFNGEFLDGATMFRGPCPQATEG